MLYNCPLKLSKSVSYPCYNLVKHSISSIDPSPSPSPPRINIYEKRKNPELILLLLDDIP